MEDLVGITFAVAFLTMLAIYLFIQTVKYIKCKFKRDEVQWFKFTARNVLLTLLFCVIFIGIDRMIPNPYDIVFLLIWSIGVYFYFKKIKSNS